MISPSRLPNAKRQKGYSLNAPRTISVEWNTSSKTTKVCTSILDFPGYQSLNCLMKGTVHGFAARPNTQLPEIKEAFEKSLEQTVSWFKKRL